MPSVSTRLAKPVGSAMLPYITGGVVLAGLAPALHLIAAGIILCIVKATLNAWVLLVEINR